MSGEGGIRSSRFPQYQVNRPFSLQNHLRHGVASFSLLLLVGCCFWLFGNRFSTLSAHVDFEAAAAGLIVSPGRGRRRNSRRGLPSEEALLDLAKTYVEVQRRLWPERHVDAPDEATLQAMAESFRSRFLDVEESNVGVDRITDLSDAAIYIRFSSDQSNPRSLDQQLRLTLQKAKSVGHFVAWSHVFADSGVTGTVAARRGYQLMQAALEGDRSLKALYFDDLSRLSRDMAESPRLCRSLHERGIRVVGASDGFDSDADQYKAILGVSGLVHEFYVDGLKKKVERGMADGFRQGKNLRPPCFGYQLVPVTTPDGKPVLNQKRQQQRELRIHQGNAEIVREIFRRFLEGGQSLQTIARWLNSISAGGRSCWGASQVADVLDRWIYIGIDLRGRTRQRKNRETGKITEELRPRSEWQVRRMRHLQVIDRRKWKAVRTLRAERAGLFKKGSSQRVITYPKRLLSLVCGSCGAPLVLGKSGKYAQVRCPNAIEAKNGCRLRGYKSLNRIESAVLEVVAARLREPDLAARIVFETNLALEEIAKAPVKDLQPLHDEIRQLEQESARLIDAIAASDAAVAVLTPRLNDCMRRLTNAKAELAAAKSLQHAPTVPLTELVVRNCLQRLHELLQEEASIAAPILKELLGDVTLSQQEEADATKPVWYAEFSWNELRVLCSQAEQSDARAGASFQHVRQTAAERVRVRIDPLPKAPMTKRQPPYIALASQAAELRKQGLTFHEIGERLGVHEATAMRACDFAMPAERPRNGRKRPQAGEAAEVRRQIAALLVDGQSRSDIARTVSCSEMTVRRVEKALRYSPPEETSAAA